MPVPVAAGMPWMGRALPPWPCINSVSMSERSADLGAHRSLLLAKRAASAGHGILAF